MVLTFTGVEILHHGPVVVVAVGGGKVHGRVRHPPGVAVYRPARRAARVVVVVVAPGRGRHGGRAVRGGRAVLVGVVVGQTRRHHGGRWALVSRPG